MKVKQSNYLLACDGSNPEFPFGFACTRCGAKEQVPDHIPIVAYLAWAKSFKTIHRQCQKPVEAQP